MSECICSTGSKSGDYDHSDYCPIGKDQRIAELQTEVQEQARLLDMSATRELGFIASLSTMEADYNAERIRADALFDQLAELEHTLEKAIIWIQHDCPFTRDEIMETLLQESSDE